MIIDTETTIDDTLILRDLRVHAPLTAPALQSVTGNLYVYVPLTATALQSVGKLYVRAPLDAPALQIVGRLFVGAPLDAPALQTVTGKLFVHVPLDAPALQTVTGDLYVHAPLNAPNLTSLNGIPGRLLAADHESGHVLWAGDDDLYYAGCAKGLTREQALQRWSRDDNRSRLFTAAILG